MGYNNFITYGGLWTHQIEFCINFTIFPGLKMPWLIAGPVKAEKKTLALIFAIGHMWGQGSGEYIPTLMALHNKVFLQGLNYVCNFVILTKKRE